MYVSLGSNEYHHGTIVEMFNSNKTEKPCVVLKCKGKLMQRSTESRTGYKVIPYRFTVFCNGMLADYVNNELNLNDNIFVIGRSDMTFHNRVQRRELVAECIYKEDWMNYWKSGDINPKDREGYI